MAMGNGALALLALLLGRGRSGSGSGTSPGRIFTYPRTERTPPPAEPKPPAELPAPPPEAKPAPEGYKPIGVPVGSRPAGPWKVYAPLVPEVVATAKQVLKSGARSLLGPDPARPGRRVFYQAEYYPGTTRRKVTAWMQSG